MRHGETDWNQRHLVQGRSNTQLNENGIRLASETGRRMCMAGIRFDRAYTSPLDRAFKTGKLVLEELKKAGPVPELLCDERLKEFSFGACEGANFEKVKNDPSHELYGFLYDPERFVKAPAGGETYEDVRKRFVSFFTDVLLPLEGKAERVLVTAHGGFIRESLCYITGRKREGYRTGGKQPNCAVNILMLEDGILKLVEEGKTYYQI